MDARVLTPSGRLRGQSRGQSLAFLGVPFAEPPVGPRRFRLPVPVRAWEGQREALQPGPSAPQPEALLPDLPASAEDCLYLNVFTPALSGARPVLVFVHGGGFSTGSGGQAMYDGQALCERGDVVVVTVNYRLGALGFAHLRSVLPAALEVEDNLALHDILCALDFVRTHIASFGGDPACVTLMGQSAGAMCNGALLAGTSLGDRAHRAVLQSGAAAHCIQAEDGAAVAERFLSALGGSRDKTDVLWQADVGALQEAQASCRGHHVHRGRPSRPVLERSGVWYPLADGRLVPSDPLAAIAAGQGARIPLLTGSTRNEWNFYLYLSDRGKLQLDELGLRKVIGKRMSTHGEAAVSHYLAHHLQAPDQALEDGPSAGRDCDGPGALFARIEGDRCFRFPVVQLAEAHAAHVAQTFVYDFNHATGLADGQMRAFHGSELPFVFGATGTEFGRMMAGNAPSVAATSRCMMDAWCSFARDGAPTSMDDFPPYTAVQRPVVVFGEQPAVVHAPEEDTRAFWDTRI